MNNADQVISSWLNGAMVANGLDNPAGPLQIGQEGVNQSAEYGVMISSIKLCDSVYTTCFG